MTTSTVSVSTELRGPWPGVRGAGCGVRTGRASVLEAVTCSSQEAFLGVRPPLQTSSSHSCQSQCILEPPESWGAFLWARAAAAGGRRGPWHSPCLRSVCRDGVGAQARPRGCGRAPWASVGLRLPEIHPQAGFLAAPTLPPRALPRAPHAARFSVVSGTVAVGPRAVCGGWSREKAAGKLTGRERAARADLPPRLCPRRDKEETELFGESWALVLTLRKIRAS